MGRRQSLPIRSLLYSRHPGANPEPGKHWGFVAVMAVVLILAGCAAGTSPPAPGTSPPAPPAQAEPDRNRPASWAPVNQPTWQIGDRWVYEWTSGSEQGTKDLQVVEVRDINGVAYYILRLSETEHYYTRALHWAAAVREGRVEARMVPPHPWF